MSEAGEIETREGKRRRLIYAAIFCSAIVLIVVGIIILNPGQNDISTRKRIASVVHMTILPPPPPPPPPPEPQKPQEKMVEQPKMQSPEFKKPERVIDHPKNAPPAPGRSAAPAGPPPGPLSLDAKGAGPGDAFGLGGDPGGNGFGGGGGGGGSRFGWYATMIQARIQEQLQRDRKISGEKLFVVVQLWLNADGSAARVNLLRRSGRHDIDQTITGDVLAMPRLTEPPPSDMPQPVNLKINISPSEQG